MIFKRSEFAKKRLAFAKQNANFKTRIIIILFYIIPVGYSRLYRSRYDTIRYDTIDIYSYSNYVLAVSFFFTNEFSRSNILRLLVEKNNNRVIGHTFNNLIVIIPATDATRVLCVFY